MLVQLVPRGREVILHQDREIGVVGEHLAALLQTVHAGDVEQQAAVETIDGVALLEGLVDVFEL
ncbi:hypothetical protein D3C76_1735930 [compost metagenome]